MRHRLLLLLLLLLVPLFTSVAATSSNTFTINLLVGTDTQPPTTPTILSATPLSTTSIQVIWSTSTDDFLLSGYQVFRDAAQIATTSQTNFTDTGLTSSTTYSYTVRAFDSFYNYSTTSAAVATTTFAVAPPTPTSTPPTATTTPSEPVSVTSSRANIIVSNFSLITTTATAAFSWSTNRPTTFALRWGRTSSYELGYISTVNQASSHTTVIDSLEAGTVYVYELIAYRNNLQPVVVSEGFFTTKGIVDTSAPANVSNLSAIVSGNDVLLRWDNPDDNDFAGVRVLRNNFFYPNNLIDGYLIYRGFENSYSDEAALSGENSAQFYTVYTYDISGNYSSGAIVLARRADSPQTGGQYPSFSTSTIDSDTVPPGQNELPTELSAAQIEVWQDSRQITFANQNPKLNAHSVYSIRIEKSALQDHLKSIIVTIADPTDSRKQYSFLLKLNPTGTAYEATIAAPNAQGTSRFGVEVYDFTTMTVTTHEAVFEFTTQIPQTEYRPFFPDRLLEFVTPLRLILFSILLLLLLLLIFLLVRRRKQEQENNTT